MAAERDRVGGATHFSPHARTRAGRLGEAQQTDTIHGRHGTLGSMGGRLVFHCRSGALSLRCIATVSRYPRRAAKSFSTSFVGRSVTKFRGCSDSDQRVAVGSCDLFTLVHSTRTRYLLRSTRSSLSSCRVPCAASRECPPWTYEARARAVGREPHPLPSSRRPRPGRHGSSLAR